MLARKDVLPLTLNNTKFHHSNLPLPDPPYLSETSIEPIDISVGRQLWVDSFLIASSSNIKFVHHQAVDVTSTPLLEPNNSDERRSNSPLPDAVLYDPIAKEYKMWYVLNYEQTPHKLCLATSQNGINWSRPVLDVKFNTFDPCCDACAKYNTKTIKAQQTNVICSFGGCRNMKGRGSGSMIMDLDEPDPMKRFKLTWGGFRQIKIYYSPDGINWTNSNTVGGWIGGSVWFLSWNPFRHKYIFTMRDNLIYASRGRLARYMEVDTITQPWSKWEDGAGNGSDKYVTGQPVQYCISDQDDYHYTSRSPGVYCAHMVAYESIMVNLFSIYHSGDGFNKRMSIYAGYSRDGFHYTRDNERRDRPLIPEMGSKSYMCPVGGNLCVTPDRVMIYYFYKEGSGMYSGCATIRRDGWVHLESADGTTESTILTRPMKVGSGGAKSYYLFVNLVISGQGYLKADILSRDGTKSLKSVEIKKEVDSCSYQIMEIDNKLLKDKTFTIRFSLLDCQFYSFWISPSPVGESNGFVGNGGPMFSSYQDKVGGRVAVDEKVQVFKGIPVDEGITLKNMRVMEQFMKKKSVVATVPAKTVVDVADDGKMDEKAKKIEKPEKPEKPVVSSGVNYLPDEQIMPVFVDKTQVGKGPTVYQNIGYDYYDMMACQKEQQLVKKQKVQQIKMPDIVGFSGVIEYHNYNGFTPGSSNFGRMVIAELINKEGDKVNLILFSNSAANAMVSNLRLFN